MFFRKKIENNNFGNYVERPKFIKFNCLFMNDYQLRIFYLMFN